MANPRGQRCSGSNPPRSTAAAAVHANDMIPDTKPPPDRMPPYARGPYAQLLARYAELIDPLIQGLRAEAVALMQLGPGDRALDVACGTGLCFPLLADAVGETGEVVGIEISPYLAGKARDRIVRAGWRNVRVIESGASSARLEGVFSGMLLFAAHEVLTSPAALDHLLPCLASDARVVTFGAQRVGPPLGWLINPLFRLASQRMLPSAPPIDERPWRWLAERLDELSVITRVGGTMYLAYGAGPHDE